MKQTYIIILLIALVYPLSVDAQISFGIRVGGGLQNINGKDENAEKLENKLIPAFNAGVNLEIPVADEFYIQTGLLFATKGANGEAVMFGIDVNTEIRISYIDIPVNFLYKPMLGDGKLLLGFGPYLGFGITGRTLVEGEALGIESSYDRDVKFKNKITTEEQLDDDYQYFRRLDAGANLLFGYEFANRLSVQLNAQLGLVNFLPEVEGADNDDYRAAHTGFGLSLGYRFN